MIILYIYILNFVMNYKFKIYKLKDEIDKYSVINTNQEISNNQYNKHKITELDKTLIFSTALFLLLNLLVTEGYLKYIENNKEIQKLKNKLNNINSNYDSN